MKKILDIILYIWQLPQNLLGELLVLFYLPQETYDFRPYEITLSPLVLLHYSTRMLAGISLGRHIIMSSIYKDYNGRAECHEYGHCRQSIYLGPLYLLVIGLPSLLGNIFDRMAHRDWPSAKRAEWYYNQPWEKWADRLGGVER